MRQRHLFASVLCLAVVAVLFGCSSEGEKEPTAKEMRPLDLIRMTPQFSQADLFAFRHPVRSEKNPFVTLETSKGTMLLELYHDVAPIHVDSFSARVREGFYDGLVFHRIIDRFMIQSGAFQADGNYRQVPYLLNAEFSELLHYEGSLGAARGQDPNSASTQFFIDLERNNQTEYLDGKYTVFGQLISGYDVLHAIGSVECVPRGSEVSLPKENVFLQRAYLCDKNGQPVSGAAAEQ